MSLLTARTKFVKLSGRYDLVSSPTAFTPDNGANAYIQAGQKFLDDLQETKFYWYKINLSIGQAVVDLSFARAIKEVWIADATSRTQLEKKDLGWIKENYNGPIASLDRGTPLYYARAVNTMAPQQAALTTANYSAAFTYGFEDIIFANETGYQGSYDSILIAPPTDAVITIEVLGKFFSNTLSADADENFWTRQYEDTLVWAALRQLDISYRNFEGAASYEDAIMKDTLGIDKNLVDEDISGVLQIEG